MNSVILDSGAQGTSRRLERLFPVLLMWGKLGVSAQNLNLPTSVSRPASIKALAANDQVKNKQGFPKHTIEHLFQETDGFLPAISLARFTMQLWRRRMMMRKRILTRRRKRDTLFVFRTCDFICLGPGSLLFIFVSIGVFVVEISC